jgi:uncharacterized protein YggE
MNGQKMSVDLRIVCLVLLSIIAGMLVVWRPWNSSDVPARTIDVVGEASVEAEPDEFQFYPSYQNKGTEREVIQQELIVKVNEVITQLKVLGVDESDITLNSNSYDNFWEDNGQQVVSNSLTVSVSDKELSQKVQDYLITTTPEGQLTPYPTFSKEKEKEIENQARTLALADAKQKADTTASELGVKVGKVVSVNDQQSGGMYPIALRGGDAALGAADATSSSSLPVLPGKQDINYTITVKYELK